MFGKAFKALGLSILMASPVLSQFGINKKQGGGGSSFEELAEIAKDNMNGDGGIPDMEQLMGMLGDVDMDDLKKMVAESLENPEFMKVMEQMQGGLGGVLGELDKLDPSALKNKMAEGLEQLTSPGMIDTILGQKEDVLATLKAQGLVTDEQIAEYEANPEKFDEEMSKAFAEMQKVFSDPETLDAAAKLMGGFSDALQNPEKAMNQIADLFSKELGDDDKIEEARLKLLEDPENAGEALASMFQNDEMKDILHDPIKWRESVKKGQGMLLDNQGAAGIGEL